MICNLCEQKCCKENKQLTLIPENCQLKNSFKEVQKSEYSKQDN